MRDLDRYRGCLIGGAVGDALGYAVEFMSASAIFRKYGKPGITDYELTNGVALISDDTQMTLFTANGLLFAKTRGIERGIMGSYIDYLHDAYVDWYATQRKPYPLTKHESISWLTSIPEMFHPRAPGITCLNALSQEKIGSIENPINNSKGCGGVMRVAPIGLYFDVPKSQMDKIDRIGAQASALTHGHELGYIPSAAFVHIVGLLSHDPTITLMDAVLDMKEAISRQYEKAASLAAFLKLIDLSISLSQFAQDDPSAIRQLGEGWVAEEALAIALYCALKYQDDFEKAMIAAVNHEGDSDSTGAIAGNILGAYMGLKGIPQKYLDHLELKDIILEMADDLYNDCPDGDDPSWNKKYIECVYERQGAENDDF